MPRRTDNGASTTIFSCRNPANGSCWPAGQRGGKGGATGRSGELRAPGDARMDCRVEARQPLCAGPTFTGGRLHLSCAGSTWASSFLSNSTMRQGMGGWPTSPKRSRRTLPRRLRVGSRCTFRFNSADVARVPKQRIEGAAVPRACLNLPPCVAGASARVVPEQEQMTTCACRRTAGGGPGRPASDPAGRQCRPSARAPQRHRPARE